MPVYRLKMWTGPVHAVEIGRKMKGAGLRVASTGTEHVYVDVNVPEVAKGDHVGYLMNCSDAEREVRAALKRKYGRDYGVRKAACHRRASWRARRRR